MTENIAKATKDLVGVLEVGGSHVTSALVNRNAGLVVPGSARRRAIDSGWSADKLLSGFVSAIVEVDAPPYTPWVVAIPGPFDYRRGVALFKGLGKFDALLNVNLASRLHAALPHLSGGITFVNDADAFAVGEWRQGVVAGVSRCVGITLGSGVGSSFLDNGVPVTDGPAVPPEGRLHRLRVGTADFEDVVSRHAILARYLSGSNLTSSAGLDVLDVFNRSQRGEEWATRVLRDAFCVLGVTLAPWLVRFDATAIAVGGAMIGSWDLIRPPLWSALITADVRSDLELLPSADPERSALVGAAHFAPSPPV